MSNELALNPASGMSAVTLLVRDLEVMTDYYTEAFALEPLEELPTRTSTRRVLGRGTTPMVRLVHAPGIPMVDRRQAGLFHTAFLFEDQSSLAAAVYRAVSDQRGRYAGAADHLVSEAFYFTDPEGNGVELYTDRPRAHWTIVNGQIQMASNRLDPRVFLQLHLTESSLEAGPALEAKVGHVHLQVGDLRRARDFYVDSLGFDVTVGDFPGAIFASVGGYHHHIAMNTWNSRGAGPRAAGLGLGDVAIAVPERADLDALAVRLRTGGVPFADHGSSIVTADPWGTQVTVSLPAPRVEDLLAAPVATEPHA
ncbi:VOC family protein [Rarobacter faecitabidus]|uniref:Catechol 2,3-dioxygenase n=1 Tax=Rarobacter faecitabidus TaxID=13243 RepID=A0A542ZUT7_RARFA|nr:VOC family protein [Rarobacter faecitabidus]TQL64133.1 catechol 2,3-dioxygenase [Rarobacter faecitabidus]